MLWKSPLFSWIACGLVAPMRRNPRCPLGFPKADPEPRAGGKTLFPRTATPRRRRAGILPKREVMSKRNSNKLEARLHRHPQLFHSRVCAAQSSPSGSVAGQKEEFDRVHTTKISQNALDVRRSSRRNADIANCRVPVLREQAQDFHRLRRAMPVQNSLRESRMCIETVGFPIRAAEPLAAQSWICWVGVRACPDAQIRRYPRDLRR